jgi:dGTPase
MISGVMMPTRQEMEEREERELAVYAVRSRATAGRCHAEPPHGVRTEFQRDRDRVLHSRAFRRLEYKTQVFVNGTADHYRTRLTHTMEMAAVGRTLARALRVNEDLTESIALAHDLGHSPFGHCGEEALDELMKNEGGFDHNLQSCRCVERLELQYPGFDGLNLTWEVRAGLRKHQAAVPGAALDNRPIGPRQFLEAQIADIADDMTYHAHDIDDGLDAGLIGEDDLNGIELWRRAGERADAQYPGIADEQRTRVTIRNVLDMQVEDVLRETVQRLADRAPGRPEDVMNAPARMAAFSPGMLALIEPLRAFLFQNVYWSPMVAGSNREAVDWMRTLFLYYVEHPESMGRKARARIDSEGLWRTACDYVAGMTDRYAMEEVARFGLGGGLRGGAGPAAGGVS